MNPPSFPQAARQGTARALRCAAVALLVGWVPCHGAAGKKRIVTTFTIIQDMAQSVAGEAATVESITLFGDNNTKNVVCATVKWVSPSHE